ncbi:hypothetical protein ACFTQL_28310 [Peribacillus butanolivorans]|uniref:hypothetical protein n=1 Tax=Peribacillus butanolivorans TaxID=421767 RepID=UPI0036441C0E
MGHRLLKAGIYAIINKKLNIVYVGETQDSFLIRWIEHTSRILHFSDYKDRIVLYLDKDTKYIILKELDRALTTKEFYKFEYEAIKFYKEKGWCVVSRHHYSEEMKEYERFKKDSTNFFRYKKAIHHMIKVLGWINTRNNNVPLLYSKLYKKINKHFETDVYKRDGKNVLESLTKEELEFIMLDLYPRYNQKILAIYREEYAKQDIQLSLF